MTDTGKELLAYFKASKEEFLQLLQKLVEEETPSHKPDSFNTLLGIIKKEFHHAGFKVHHRKGEDTAGQLLCTPEHFDYNLPYQLVLGHCDTVWEEGTLQEMPFKVEGNAIWGPGCYDMKTGLCMMIFALKAIRKMGRGIPVQPVFLINTDEEIGSKESEYLIIQYAKKASRTYVLEPSLGNEGKIKTRRKGIGEFKITIKGKPSHAGLAPEEGVSAILGLSHIVQQLFKLNDAQNGISVNVGTIEGGERANVIAAKSKAVVDVRIPTNADGERITEKIHNLQPEIEGIDLEITGGISRPPLEKNEANQKLWQLTLRLGQELGLELQEGTSGGASDGNITNQYAPTIDGLGAVGEGAHAYHEKIFLEETLQRNALLALLLMQPEL